MRKLKLQLNTLLSPLLHLFLFSTSPVGFHPLYATETLSGALLTTIIYQIQWATPNHPHTWSLGSIWQSCPLLHYWHIYLLSLWDITLTWTFCLLDFFITILISLLVIGLLMFLLFPSSVLGVLAFFGICSPFFHCPVYWLIVVYRNILWLYFCSVCNLSFFISDFTDFVTLSMLCNKRSCHNEIPMHCN